MLPLSLSPIPMPLNSLGEGPETDQAKVVKVQWQLWDELNCTVAVCRNEEIAKALAASYNSKIIEQPF